MNFEQYLKNFQVPSGKIDVVLDTDTYNEIDDQFAIAYMLKNPQRFNLLGITIAPFFLDYKAKDIKQGIEKSYNEVIKLLELTDNQSLFDRVFKGCEDYLPDEKTAVESSAVDFIIDTAKKYSQQNPLYVVAIGAITNVASAIIKAPDIAENIVIVWLGGHAHHMPNTDEFNMVQDVAAARIVFGCSAPLVQLPCVGVVDRFATTKYELMHWIAGKNKLCDFLVQTAINEVETGGEEWPWSRVIWDVTAVAWLCEDKQRFMSWEIVKAPMPTYDNKYESNDNGKPMVYVYYVNRDALFGDLFRKLGE